MQIVLVVATFVVIIALMFSVMTFGFVPTVAAVIAVPMIFVCLIAAIRGT